MPQLGRGLVVTARCNGAGLEMIMMGLLSQHAGLDMMISDRCDREQTGGQRCLQSESEGCRTIVADNGSRLEGAAG